MTLYPRIHRNGDRLHISPTEAAQKENADIDIMRYTLPSPCETSSAKGSQKERCRESDVSELRSSLILLFSQRVFGRHPLACS